MKKRLLTVALAATALAALLTWFYVVHEGLPRAIRAPTSLLLAPVAIADGLAYYLGLERGVYGSLPRVFAVNWLGWAVLCGLLLGVGDRLRSRRSRSGGVARPRSGGSA